MEITWQELAKEGAKFFSQPTLYYTYIIVAADFAFGLYRSYNSWRIQSHLFDRTVDKLTKYTLTYILFHALSLFPLPKMVFPVVGFEIFDPQYIDDVVLFIFMCRETLSILENIMQADKRHSWPGLDTVVGFLGKLFRLAAVEERNANANKDRTQVDHDRSDIERTLPRRGDG